MRFEELEKMYRLEDAYWWFLGRRRLVRDLVRRYAPANGRILDVGCGTGGTLDALADIGQVFGFDASADALLFCRERGHCCLAQSLAEALAAQDSSFDVAVCCDLFEHLDDDEMGIAEVMRVLKPGGVAITTVPAYQWLWSEHDEALSHRRRYSAREIRRKMEEQGAHIVKLTYAVSLVFPVVMLFRLLRRMRLQETGKPHTQLMTLPQWANRLLVRLHDAETWWIRYSGFPFGTSVVVVARKPG